MNLSPNVVCPMAACKKCGECVRHSGYLEAKASAEHYDMLNPEMVTPNENGCKCLLIKEKQRIAYGFKNLVAEVKKKDSRWLFTAFHYGSQSSYDRRRRGEYSLNPQEQARVLGIFQRFGVDTSIGFDHYQIEDVLVEPNAEKEP